MIRACLLAALGLFLPVAMLLVADGPTATAQVGQDEGKGKKKKETAGEEEKRLDKMLDKLARPVKTERDKLLEALAKLAKEQQLERPEAGDAEFHTWFDVLCGDSKVWLAEDAPSKTLREFFARVASALEISGDEIRRDQFLNYARQRLSPGRSPPWDQKPPKPPKPATDEASKLFRKLDRDGDGVLSAEEMPPALREELKRWDDGDGQIDGEEYARYFESRLRRVADERGVRPPGPPGEQNPALPRVYRPGKLPEGLPAWFGQRDDDGDGQVGLYEWKAAGRPLDEFLLLDLNRDGFVTAEEWLRVHRTTASRVAQVKR